jgi:ferritin-like metal-binding protein YciE
MRQLLLEELRDLYSGETLLLEALPRMVAAAHASELRAAFVVHLNQTREQLARLERVFRQLNESPQGEMTEVVKSLIYERHRWAEAQGEKEVIDAGLIGVARRVEHYEMAGYETLGALMRRRGEHQIADLLQQTWEEESEFDKKPRAIAETIVNPKAASHR